VRFKAVRTGPGSPKMRMSQNWNLKWPLRNTEHVKLIYVPRDR